MKLSKTLIQSIVVGLAIGTTVSSCDLAEELGNIKPDNCEETSTEKGENEHNWDDCPGCGLG